MALGSLPSHGQEGTEIGSTDSLVIMCRDYGDSVIVRWAPTSWAVLQAALNNGFVLEQMEYFPPGDSANGTIRLDIPPREAWTDHPQGEKIQALLYNHLNDRNNQDHIFQQLANAESSAMRLSFLLLMADLDFQLAKKLSLGWTTEKSTGESLLRFKLFIPGWDIVASTYNYSKSKLAPPAIDEFYGIPEDRIINLQWDAKHMSSTYVAFFVEHRVRGGSWQILNSEPLVIVDPVQENTIRHWMTYRDSVANNYVDQYYRIYGVTAFGEQGPVSKTLVIQAQPPVEINSPFLSDVRTDLAGNIALKWQLAGRDSVRVVQQYIKRAPHPDSTFQIVDTLDGASRSYIDSSAALHNYYLIEAVDDIGRLYTGSMGYGQLPDSEPPAAPTGLTGIVDTNGVVRLHWHANQEEDLLGYRVFYERHLEDEAIQLTTSVTSDTFYTDAIHLNTLHHHTYYSVQAEDHVGNRSNFSEPIHLRLPDTIAPPPPTIVMARSSVDHCTLDLLLSESDDMAQQILRRRNAQENTWTIITNELDHLAQSRYTYLDTTLEIGQEVVYQLVAMDSSGNVSSSNEASGRRIDSKIRPAAIDPSISWNRRSKTYDFLWSYLDQFSIRKIRIYRSKIQEEIFHTYKYLDPNSHLIKTENHIHQFKFSLTDQRKEHTYKYKIKLEFDDGAVSQLVDFEMN